MAEITQRQSLTQTMRQEQTMTQKQIQALELLFLPVLELQAMIDTELEKNPLLETEGEPDNAVKDSSLDDDQWLDNIMKLDEENRYIRSRGTTYSKDDEEKRKHYLDSITTEKSFQQQLLDQIRFLDLDPDIATCCEVVISGLDDGAYLTSHPADLAMASGQSIELVNRAIEVVKTLEPPGVGAKNLQERLLIQLERKGKKDSLAYAAVRDYLDDIANNHLPQVAKKMKITIDDVKDIIQEIQELTPHIMTDSVSPHEYINEEVFIEDDEEEGGVKVKINNEYLPNLHISNHYRKLLDDPATPKETRDYIKDKLRSGVFLINSILQRQSTIKRIVSQIVDIQKEFFTEDMNKLKPMTMSNVAAAIGVHETTVSRAVSGKYLRCKYGVFPLKHFFSTGYEGEDGEAVSKNVVKTAISKMIAAETPTAPLSDSQIADKLKDLGYKVARRTVAKYRESMDILPSNLRRQY